MRPDQRGSQHFLVTGTTALFPPAGGGTGVVQANSSVKAGQKVAVRALVPITTAAQTVRFFQFDGTTEYDATGFVLSDRDRPLGPVGIELREGLSVSTTAAQTVMIVFDAVE